MSVWLYLFTMLTLFSSMVWAFVLGPTIASMLLLFILFITTSFSHCKLVVVWIYEQVRFQSYRWTRATLFYLSAFTLWMSLCALARVISAELYQMERKDFEKVFIKQFFILVFVQFAKKSISSSCQTNIDQCNSFCRFIIWSKFLQLFPCLFRVLSYHQTSSDRFRTFTNPAGVNEKLGKRRMWPTGQRLQIC